MAPATSAFDQTLQGPGRSTKCGLEPPRAHFSQVTPTLGLITAASHRCVPPGLRLFAQFQGGTLGAEQLSPALVHTVEMDGAMVRVQEDTCEAVGCGDT